MLKFSCNRWELSIDVLRDQALSAEHPRTRERWMALYEICAGKNATKVGIDTGRNPQAIIDLLRESGGRSKFKIENSGNEVKS